MILKNQTYSKLDQSKIDCEIDHPVFGWIPFTASPDDVEAYGRELFDKLKAGEFGAIADYVPPVVISPVIDSPVINSTVKDTPENLTA